MDTITKDFVSSENRDYRFKIGRVIASSLSGFIAGMIGGGIAVWIYLVVKNANI